MQMGCSRAGTYTYIHQKLGTVLPNDYLCDRGGGELFNYSSSDIVVCSAGYLYVSQSWCEHSGDHILAQCLVCAESATRFPLQTAGSHTASPYAEDGGRPKAKRGQIPWTSKATLSHLLTSCFKKCSPWEESTNLNNFFCFSYNVKTFNMLQISS